MWSVFSYPADSCFTGASAIGLIHKSQNAAVPYAQCSIQNRNMYTSVLNEALWNVEQVHSGICEIGMLYDCPRASELCPYWWVWVWAVNINRETTRQNACREFSFGMYRLITEPGPVSLRVFCSKFKFDGNFTLPWFNYRSSDSTAFLYMPRQHSCRYRAGQSRASCCISLWAFHQIRKIVGCACAGNAGNVLPATAG